MTDPDRNLRRLKTDHALTDLLQVAMNCYLHNDAPDGARWQPLEAWLELYGAYELGFASADDYYQRVEKLQLWAAQRGR